MSIFAVRCLAQIVGVFKEISREKKYCSLKARLLFSFS